MAESLDLEFHGDVEFDEVEDMIRKIFLTFYIPGACFAVYITIRDLQFSNFPQLCRLIAKRMMTGENVVTNKQDDPHSRRPNNHLEGLKEIGETYIGQTYRVIRLGSFNQSSRT